MFMEKRLSLGFTLAEVLVTLGIIGVVSAMTVPTLMKNHQRQVYVTQLHKVYNEFSQAADAYISSKNAINLLEAGLSSQAGVSNFLQSQFKTVKNCGTFTDCFADNYKNMNGSNVQNYSGTTESCYALSSGASVCLTYGRFMGGIGAVNIIVDVNGKSGPNIIGRDLFILGMADDGTISSNENLIRKSCRTLYGGTNSQVAECEAENNWNDLERCQNAKDMAATGNGAHCFGKILDDGFKMEY